MLNCLVFDFDGVIINSHELQMKAFRESYRYVVGREDPPYEEFFRNSGDSLYNILKKMGLPLEMIPYYIEISTKNLNMIKVQDGIKEALLYFAKMGYQSALCTGKDRKRTIDILEHLNLDSYFKAIVCSDDVAHPKPAPDSLLHAVKLLNGKCKNTIMIGDGINDIICAKKANITSVGVTWGDSDKGDIIEICPDYIANTVKEMINAVNEKFGALELENKYEKDKDIVGKRFLSDYY